MARLFSKDYHAKSNTWYFSHAVIPLERGDLLYWKSLDETGNIHLHFFANADKREYFNPSIDIVYNPREEQIEQHECTECADDENCRHYLSILHYAYHYLNTDIFSEEIIETCYGNILSGEERWQILVHGAKIQLENVYNLESDKIRFYLGDYDPIDIMQMLQVLQGKDVEGLTERTREEYQEIAAVFTDYELQLFWMLLEKRSAYSSKSKFFSIYKKDFHAFLIVMRNMKDKFVIKETLEPLEFIDHTLSMSIRIEKINAEVYLVRPILIDELSVWYSGYPTWLFFRNQVRHIDLPFRKETIDILFNRELLIKINDLVYFRTIVHQQLRNTDIYLDFDEQITLPQIIDSAPKIHLIIRKMDDAVTISGFLNYESQFDVPLSVVRFKSPLIKSSFRNNEDPENKPWFYIPPAIFQKMKILLDALPFADLNRLEEHSELVILGDANIEKLKKAIYELTETDWDIDIDPALQNEFVYKVPLKVEINTRAGEEIDWFSYDIRYRYKDFSFSHEELAKFFKTNQQFMHTQDGRIVFITNRDVFDEMDKLIAKSEKKNDETYRSRILNLPYYMRLREENPAFSLLGDSFINQMFRDLLERHTEKKESLPIYLQAILRGYQKAGYAWLKMLQHYRLNGVLADEMGLGKTIQALAILADTPDESVSLVVCPKTLQYNWAAEIEKFHTNIPFAIVEGDRLTRAMILDSKNIKLFIISYSIVLNDLDHLKKIQFEWVLLDEAQNIKNVTAQRTGAIKKLNANHRMALSGTPIENSLIELWSIFDFLMPGYLGTLGRFKKEYQTDGINPEAGQKLHRAVAPFILRRKKKEVLLELPDKQEQISWCRLTSVQEKLYLQIIEMVRKTLFHSDTENPSYIHILSALTKLRQVCNHPSLVNPDILAEIEASSKLEQLLELVTEAIESGHKILVFSQFVQMLKIIRKVFDDNGITYSYLDGQTKDRITPIQSFNADPNIKVFLISLKTGGTGLNLTAADTVILFDPWWNPMIENQAIDRTHRIGQTNKVQVIRLITKGTVEEKILALQQTKLDLFKSVIEDGQQIIKTISIDEMRSLFHYE
ncbi:MAG: ATP-dependent helicase [Candidatus Cloacimonetes bacterium HGW-Cloacimonetes-1]|jgi:SNF2 family DNA or RNA helicase|nr:MAG: ATP-dependent helicase [Candidatus Cloacimonetes bacterium HGW-Cloacimonetes-1]